MHAHVRGRLRQTERLLEELFENLLQQRHGHVNTGLFDTLAGFFPDRVVASGVEKFVADPSQPQRDCSDRLTTAVQDGFSVDQPSFNEQSRMIDALIFAVCRQVGLRLFAFGCQQEQPDEIHVAFHAQPPVTRYVPAPRSRSASTQSHIASGIAFSLPAAEYAASNLTSLKLASFV